MTEPGQTLAGRYRIESVLGQGGMGAVYLATMEALGGKKVAIKEMELRGFSERELEAAVKQFQSEARFLANLDHPNLVQVTDFFVEGDKHYLVMAYVAGQTLQQKLRARGRAFPWGQVREWARPLCAVLTYLHSQSPPILFRDLKPSNIMVEDSGRLRLIDFGIARTGQDGERTSTFLQGTGTSGFSPLEQYGGGQSTDHRSDIYSLGATLYQLLTGKVPPDAVSRVSQGVPVQAPSSLVPELPRALDQILLRALAQNKADRQQSVAELAAQLEGVVESSESETEDLRPAPGLAADTGRTEPSSPQPASASPSPPNITVELMPSAPTTTPLQMAAGLGAVAVVTLLLGSMLMSRDAATAADGTKSPAPIAQAAKAPPKTPGETAPSSPVPRTASGPTKDSVPRGALPTRVPVNRPRERVVERVNTTPSEPQTQKKAVPRVVSAKIAPETTVPTASRPAPARQPEPEPVAARQPQPNAAPPALPEPPNFEPPPIPDGMPTPILKDKNGRWLPPSEQPAGFPGSRHGPGEPGWRPGDPYPPPGPEGEDPPSDPTGYDTRRRR